MKKLILNIIILFLIGSHTMAQLVISPESSITVTNGTSLYVGTSLFLKSDATGSGHIADQNISGNIDITGDISIERYLTQDGWHNVSAPLNNLSSTSFTGTDLIFYYDETIIMNDWNFGWVLYEGPLEIMRGYDVFLPTTTTTTYYAPSAGSLNTGTYTQAITRTNPPNGEVLNRKGWNLLGNPYPSPVDWIQESGWNKNDINDAKYIWNPDNNNYTIFLGGSSPTGINDATQYIPSNQGFWVQAVQNGSVQINNSARMGVAELTPGYYKNNNSDVSELRLIASGNGYTDETLIRFIEESTIDFDINLDASKLFTLHDSVPQINTVTANNLLAINTLPELTDGLKINLNFVCNSVGTYSISISENSTIDDRNSIYIADKLLGNIHEITTSRDYYFQHSPFNNESRFVVYFNPSEDILNNDLNKNEFTLTTSKNTITVIRNTTMYSNGIINIYSLLGQKISTVELTNAHKTSFNLIAQSGYYIASIIVDNQAFNYKIKISE